MELIDRYLYAVRQNLPAAKADDIVAELRDDLVTRQESREEALGRPLTREETSALITEFGHPLVVAARYRTQQWLIGPDVFPFYVFVMRIMVLIIVGIDLAVGIGRALFEKLPLFAVFGQTMGSIWTSLLLNLAIVTIIFAVMERAGFPAEHLRKWRPDQLPDIKDKPKSAWESAFEVAMGVVFLLWWTGVIRLPFPTGGPDFRIEPTPVIAQLYWPILALVAARLVLNLIEWLRPRWKLVRGILAAGTTLAGLGLLGMIYRAGRWATIVSTGMPADKAAELDRALNLGLKIAIIACACAWIWQCLLVLWRLARERRG